MNLRNVMKVAGMMWMLATMTAVAQTGDVLCVVCGEATAGGQAVLLGDKAFAIHEFGCQPIWQRAEKQWLLRSLDPPLSPGHAVFQTPGLAQSDPSERISRGSARVWAAFLLGACLMSGSLATLFGILTHRPRGRAFILGFCLPAVGMVLVPVLPDLSKPSKPVDTNEGETS